MRAAAALLACLALAAPSAASAQVSDAPRPTRRVIPVAPARTPEPAPARSTPVPDAPGRLALSGVGGLPQPSDGGATCRSGCARIRYACEVQEETCAAYWSACLKGCGGAQPTSTLSLLPR